MMKFGICLLLVLAVTSTTWAAKGKNGNGIKADMKCEISSKGVPEQWISMDAACTDAVHKQIQMEIDASYQYLAMGAHFSLDTINRPGFAEHFFKAAREEREHGSKLIEYLSMRGELTKDVNALIRPPVVTDRQLRGFSGITIKTKWSDVDGGVEALRDALELETKVTDAIRGVIQVCEQGKNDYHLVDYLTGVYLEEQLHGQRELAGKLTTLNKMMGNHGALAEFLFDKNNL